MSFKISLLVLLFNLLLCSLHLHAQIKDDILWSGIKINKQLDTDTRLVVIPIFRHNENVSSYLNSSLDIALSRKISDNWYFQFLARTWFVPNENPRQFAWLDIGYKTSLDQFSLLSRFRVHYALNINNRDDPDYFRWLTVLSSPRVSRFQVTFGIEPWFRIEENFQYQRFRYLPGVNVKLSDIYKFSFVYWREESRNLEPTSDFNIYVATLTIDLP